MIKGQKYLSDTKNETTTKHIITFSQTKNAKNERF